MAKSEINPKPVGQKERSRVIAYVKKQVLKHHFNAAGVDYNEWTQSVDQRTSELFSADVEGFEGGIRDLLAKLGSSHTLFYRETGRQVLPQHSVNATLHRVSTDGVDRWMFLDVFDEGPAHAAGIKPGDFLLALDGAECTPPAMPPFEIGQTHRVTVSEIGRENARDVEVRVPHRKGTRGLPPIVEPKSVIQKVIGPNIGLLKILYFPGEMGLRFSKQLDAAVTALKRDGVSRLVIDLRGSIGGGLGLARLASYMCPGHLSIGHSLTRRRLHLGYDVERLPRVPMPSSKAKLLLTLGRFSVRDKSLVLLTQGLGPQPFHHRIVIIVNEWTNSAAEMVAGFASDHRLATIVGDKTAGNVLGAANFKVGSGYILRLPIFGWYTPRGTWLEGKGVAPDIQIEANPNLLSAGVDQQMNKALEILTAADSTGNT